MSSHPSETDSNSDGRISRHDFIKYVGATGAILGLSSLPFIKTFAALSNGTNPQTNFLTPSESKQISHTSPHTFNLDSISPQLSNAAGNRTIANADNFPILGGWSMAVYLLRLKIGGVREPHWHPNAAELTYCVSGRAEMTIYPSNTDADSFTVDSFTIDPGGSGFYSSRFYA